MIEVLKDAFGLSYLSVHLNVFSTRQSMLLNHYLSQNVKLIGKCELIYLINTLTLPFMCGIKQHMDYFN